MPDNSSNEKSKLPRFENRDRRVNYIAEKEGIRFCFTQANAILTQAVKRHQLNEPTAMLWGELMVNTVLASSILKGDERFCFQINAKGPIKLIHVEAMGNGEIRGYVSNPQAMAEGEDARAILKNIIAGGTLLVEKVIFGSAKPFQSTTEILYNEISQDMVHYWYHSEQIPTLVRSYVTPSEAYGLLMQMLPDGDSEKFERWQEKIMTSDWEYDTGSDQYKNSIQALVGEELVLKEVSKTPIDFFCRCNKEKFTSVIAGFQKNELAEMADDGTQELVCHFCNEKYYVTPDDLREMIHDKDK